jgi:hypothetical protein
VPSLDPFEDSPSRPDKAGGKADNIEVAPGLEQSRPLLDPQVASSWSALEAAGLLPKRGLETDISEDGWPVETSPSGTVRVIPPPPPPPAAPPVSRTALSYPPGRLDGPVVLRPDPLPPAPVTTASLDTSYEPAFTDANPTGPIAMQPVAAQAVMAVTAPAADVATAAATATAATAAVAVGTAATARARTTSRPTPATALVRGPRVVGRTVGRRHLFGRRPRVRKVSRVVRRIDGWTVFKISLVLYALLYVILVIAGVLLWHLAYTTGTVDNIQGFIKELFGLKTFVIDGKKLFHASRTLGLVMAIGGTGLHVTLVVLFNLIADLVGGVRVTVLEEEVLLRDRDSADASAESD